MLSGIAVDLARLWQIAKSQGNLEAARRIAEALVWVVEEE